MRHLTRRLFAASAIECGEAAVGIELPTNRPRQKDSHRRFHPRARELLRSEQVVSAEERGSACSQGQDPGRKTVPSGENGEAEHEDSPGDQPSSVLIHRIRIAKETEPVFRRFGVAQDG